MMYQNINNNSFIIGQNRTKNNFLMRSKIISDLDISKNQKNNTFINNNDYKLSSMISSNYAQKNYFKPKDLKVKLEEFKFDSQNLNTDCFTNENSLNSSNQNHNIINNENKNNNNFYINHKHADTTILSDYNNKNKIIENYGPMPMKEYSNKKIRKIMYNNFCTLRVNKNYANNNNNNNNSSKYSKIRGNGNREEKNYVNYNRSNNNSLSPKINFKKILLGTVSPKIFNLNRKDSNNSLKSFSNNSNILDMKDEYIEYLQKKFQNNFHMNSKLEKSIKELNIRCNNLINDNKLLNETLNERTTKLNELIQENENYKKERKNNKNLYQNIKKENLNRINIIKNLKEEISRLKNSLIIEKEKNKEYEKKLKKYEIEFENRIEEEKLKIKKAYQNSYNLNNKESNEMKYYENEIELIKKQSNIYLTNLKSKEKSIELMTKENEKLLNENIIYRTQIEQYSNKISELYDIIKQKEKYIQANKYNNKKENYNIDTNNGTNNSNNNSNNYSNNTNNNNQNNSNNNILENKYQITKINYYYFDKKNGKQNGINHISNLNLNNSYNKLIGNKVFLSSIKMNKLNKDFKNNSFEIRANIFNKNNEIKVRNMRKIFIDKKIKKDKDKMDKIDKIKNKNSETIEKYISEGLNLKEKKEEEKEKDKQILIKKINSYYSENKNKDKKEKEKDKDKDKEKRLKIEIEEINEAIKKISQKKNYTYKPKVKKKFQILDGIEVTEINTSSPVIQQNISFSSDNHMDKTKLFLFGIDQKENLLIFDILNKKWSFKKILDIEDISETFKKNYQYEGTILYNTLNGIFILTGKKTNILYYYNALNDSINRVCKFNDSHDNGSLLLDKNKNRIFVFSGKNTKSCEFYSFKDKTIYKIGDLLTDRANASFVISDNKIYGFFGFSYQKNNYANNIEFVDYDKLEKWEEMNINNLKSEIRFDIESVGTIKFGNDSRIIIYSGIQGENEDYIGDYYYIFDTINKTFAKTNKCAMNQYKYHLYKWKKYKDNEKDIKGFHFSKNSNFLILPKDVIIKNYPENMAVLIDYTNNIHFIDDKLNIIDIYRANS